MTSFNIREQFCNEIENILFDILLRKTKPILMGVLYSPPDQSDCVEHFVESISNTDNFDNQEVYILGDFNIDVTNNKNNTPLNKLYKEICCLRALKQLLQSPTRITVTT